MENGHYLIALSIILQAQYTEAEEKHLIKKFVSRQTLKRYYFKIQTLVMYDM